MKYINTLSVLALASTTWAQTFSDCDPTKKTGCPSKPGLATADYSCDFRQGAAAANDWTATSGSVSYVADGSEFTIKSLGEGPTIQSNFYMFFGYVEVVMKAATGAGIVSSFVMESDDLDEIDWEWIGSDAAQAQSNYFGKGNTTTYDRGQFHPVTTPQADFHTYAVNWTQETTTWLIDGNIVRTLNFADAVGGQNYPQTPMNIRLGNWVAGDPKNAPGTIQWAGGLTDFSQGPFNMFVQSVKVINYNPGTSYAYNDQSGSWQSITVSGNAPTAAGADTTNSTTGPGAVPFNSESAPASASTDSSDCSDCSGSAATSELSAAATSAAATSAAPMAAAASSIPASGAQAAAQASVITINTAGGNAAATKKPCSTVTKSGIAAAAMSASGGKPTVVTIEVGRNNSGAIGAASATMASGGKPSVVSINLGPGSAAATAMKSNSSSSGSNGGIVAQGAPLQNGTLATVTIGLGKNGTLPAVATSMKTGITTAPAAATAAGASGGTSFAIGASSTTSAQAQQQTTNAGSKLEMGGAAVAALIGVLAAW